MLKKITCYFDRLSGDWWESSSKCHGLKTIIYILKSISKTTMMMIKGTTTTVRVFFHPQKKRKFPSKWDYSISSEIGKLVTGVVFNFRISRTHLQFNASLGRAYIVWSILWAYGTIIQIAQFMWKFNKIFLCVTYFLSLLPAPVSRNPFAKGLLSIFNCVICEMIKIH